MRKAVPRIGVTVLLGLALAAAGCRGGPIASASFDRTLTITGPVHVELQNGSGRVEITAGQAGQVRIHGEVQERGFSFRHVQQRAQEIADNPPIEQQGNLVRVGYERFRLQNISISYRIDVPPETELQTEVGSGNLTVKGVRGPARLTTGSGSIVASDIHDDAEVNSGSGSLTLANIGGEVRANTGSGGITLSQVRGEIRAGTGSGHVTITDPGGRIAAHTGSGGVTIRGAAADLRAKTGSGSITVAGNPTANCYWELHTGSGSISLDVPANASFRFHARTSSGNIETAIPVVIEERSKKELRARVGDGGARVDVDTGSGSIHIR